MRITSLRTAVAHLVGPGKLKIVNGRLAFSGRDRPPVRLDPEALTFLFGYGDVGITDEAMTVLLRHGVSVAWLTPGGTACRGRTIPVSSESASLRYRQYRAFTDPDTAAAIARYWVMEKVERMAITARHFQRHGVASAGDAMDKVLGLVDRCRAERDLDRLRGLEGAASAEWFRLFAGQLRSPWTFPRRARRPPPDPVNALLSLGYTWLLTRVAARCEALGLEVYLGALHAYHPGRPSLACDVMEPLRVPAVDRWVLRLLNQGELKLTDFEDGGERGFRLQSSIFGPILHSWESYWLNEGPDELLDEHLGWLVQRLRPIEPRDSLEADDG